MKVPPKSARPAVNARTAAPDRPLWVCPKCGKWFVTRNNWHSCSIVPWRDHFQGKPKARELFEHFRKAVESLGPVRLVSNRTRLAFMARVRFTGCEVRRDWLRCGLWLKRRVDCPRFVKVERYTDRDFGYLFELRKPEDLDRTIMGYLREAYQVGRQQAVSARR